jgi:lipopolysaccharide biosynthesis protein
MHRSGTSLVARMLRLASLRLGPPEELATAPGDEPYHFEENRHMVAINDAILEALGGGWDLPPHFPAGWPSDARLDPIRQAARERIAKLAAPPAWGWKDPRNSLTLPFWKTLLPRLQVVVCVRHPLEVVESLRQRGYASAALGLHLWYVYNRSLLENSQPDERIVTHFAALLADPLAELRRILQLLPLDPDMGQLQEAFASADGEKRHHRFGEDDLRRLPAEVKATYLALVEEAGPAQGQLRPSRRRRQGGGRGGRRRKLEEKSSMVRLSPYALDDRLASARQQIEEGVAARVGLKQKIEALTARLDDMSRQVEAAEGAWKARLAEVQRTWDQIDRSLREELLEAQAEAEQATTRAHHLEQYVGQMHLSVAFRFLHRYRTMLDRAAPLGSVRRRFYLAVLGGARRAAGLGPPRPSAQGSSGLTGDTGAPRAPRVRPTLGSGERPQGVAATLNPYQMAYEDAHQAMSQMGADYVPLSDPQLDMDTLPVRLIAFYLPQFHPIPENDAWWRKGFTEWTNVSKAVPQFVGHYQPRLPGELGFYDLRVPEVLHRQVELARTHGISGFCFHFFWFNGRRLLERPLDTFVHDPEIDFPFCLCWANENWTRRWDGREDDVLIAQEYNEQSDQAFIRDIEPYLRHRNYIHVDGRPILIVYRAQALPDPARTAERWKAYCRSVGLPEPYLIAAQTFGFEDPREVGFDAAVEFPPLNFKPRSVKSRQALLNEGFRGDVFSYWDLVRASIGREKPSYRLIRTVVPGWDNTARRGGNGYAIVHSTPAAYRFWLANVVRQEMKLAETQGRLVFANAWNEWAEGAYLEPDGRFGYAYLRATAEAVSEATLAPAPFTPSGMPVRRNPIAVIAHLFYPALLPEIEQHLQNLGSTYDLYVSIPEGSQIDEEALRSWKRDVYIYRCPNRGRDVAPFVQIFKVIAPLGYDLICKVHTKRSPHRADGDAWRSALLRGVLGSRKQISSIRTRFVDSSDVGIVTGAGAARDGTHYMGPNRRLFNHLCDLANLTNIDDGFRFPAGSIFWFRPDALLPVASLPLTVDDFEEESGQTNGTLAHAFERFIGFLCQAQSFEVVETGSDRASPTGAVAAPLRILVYQMGKVGSKSVFQSLTKYHNERGIPLDAHHIHFLTDLDEMEAIVRRERENPKATLRHIAKAWRLRERVLLEDGQPWNVISLVREPVARNIATHFHTLHETIPDWKARMSDGRLDLKLLQDLFFSTPSIHSAPIEWFDKQLKPVFGVDVYATPFPHEKGYQIYLDEPRAPTLAIRLEDLDRCSAEAMSEFLGLEDFLLTRANVGAEKDYAEVYEAFKRIPLPKEYVEATYATKYARHFYTDAERAAFAARWTGQD